MAGLVSQRPRSRKWKLNEMLFHVKRNFEARTLFVKTTPCPVDSALFRLLFFYEAK
jgi:hypothetical protein